MSEKDTKKGKAAAPKGGGKPAQPQGEGKKGKGKQGDAQGKQAAADVIDERPSGPKEPPRLHTFYRDQVMKDLTQQFGYKSPMQVPRIEKITVNMGVGEAVADKKIMDNAVADLTKITGQKPLVTRARKSVATFKVRDGLAIGAKV